MQYTKFFSPALHFLWFNDKIICPLSPDFTEMLNSRNDFPSCKVYFDSKNRGLSKCAAYFDYDSISARKQYKKTRS